MALSGDFVEVSMDDSGGTLRTFNDGDITSVELGLTNDQYDVAGFGSDVHNMINGMVQAPVTLKGFLTTDANVGTHPVIQGAYAAGSQVTLKVAVGQNAAPQSGDPEYSGEFIVASYVPSIGIGGAVAFTATLNPATNTAPSWGTKA